MMVAVPPDRDPQPVRAFRPFTPDLRALVAWLLACGSDTGALESTGVLWIPMYDLLEAHGIMPYLVNAQHVKTVPGRKSDGNDAQWLQKLPMLGLLQGSFRPAAEIRALRTLVRQRADLIQQRAPPILPMQPALKPMNLHLSVVLAAILGTTGQAIMRAIVQGARDPVARARLRHPACPSSEETIAKALTGTWHAEHRLVLPHALARFDFYPEHITACDAQLEAYLRALEPRRAGEPPPAVPPAKPTARSRKQPRFNARAEFVGITGVDLVAVTGRAAASVQTIRSEIGTEMTRFPSSKHCCSWLGLAPHNDLSGGKILRAHPR
jgi:transposase